MKYEKEEKDVIDYEVKVIIDLKYEFKYVNGEEWNLGLKKKKVNNEYGEM
jgi:hypothetical protein